MLMVNDLVAVNRLHHKQEDCLINAQSLLADPRYSTAPLAAGQAGATTGGAARPWAAAMKAGLRNSASENHCLLCAAGSEGARWGFGRSMMRRRARSAAAICAAK